MWPTRPTCKYAWRSVSLFCIDSGFTSFLCSVVVVVVWPAGGSLRHILLWRRLFVQLMTIPNTSREQSEMAPFENDDHQRSYLSSLKWPSTIRIASNNETALFTPSSCNTRCGKSEISISWRLNVNCLSTVHYYKKLKDRKREKQKSVYFPFCIFAQDEKWDFTQKKTALFILDRIYGHFHITYVFYFSGEPVHQRSSAFCCLRCDDRLHDHGWRDLPRIRLFFCRLDRGVSERRLCRHWLCNWNKRRCRRCRYRLHGRRNKRQLAICYTV